jgi:catechol 2,3-dioxygenase-like lactoylglutathione lyase family enzyme
MEYAAPVLPSRDLDETLAFYVRLGFENHGAAPDEWDYLIIGRGDVRLHFRLEPSVDPLSTAGSCYVYVDDADALHGQWAPHVVPDQATGSRLEPPTDMPYGMRQFALVDPSGNLVSVGTQIART